MSDGIHDVEMTPTTKAQDRAIVRLSRRHGGLYILGQEPGSQTIRVRVAGPEPAADRLRVITPSGLVQEVLA